VPSQTATILVTDLVASTELRARLGEERADRLRRLYDRLLRTSVETHGGLVVKGLGDGVLASFTEANGAVAAAVAIQRAADAHTRSHPEQPLVLEPGVGETRLAGEVARRVHEAGGAVLYGRCEEDLGVPYEPFVEALTFFCEHTRPEDLRTRLGRYPGELTRLLPDLGELVPGLDPLLRSDPETEQYRLFEAVASWLGAAGEATGLLLVVEDLHWAPPPTIHLLAHVLRAAGSARLLVVATFRDTDVGSTHPLSPVLADLRRTSGVERIFLGGLSIDELAELVEDLPKGQAGRALAATLHEGTEGNPFFVGEILRHVAESGLAVEALPVPEGVREITVSRVARLAPATRELLGVAAVLGRDLELTPLAAVAGVDEDAVVEGLDDGQGRRRTAEGMAIADETGQPGLRSLASFYHAAAVDALGDHHEAARLTQAAFDLGQEAGYADALNWYGARMWLHWTFEGQAEVAAAGAAMGFAEYPRLVIWQAAWALDLALTGQSAELASLLTGIPSAPPIPMDVLWLATHSFFAAAQGFGVEHPGAAAAVYDRLLPYRTLHAAYGIGYLGPVEMALAVLARVLGDIDGALAHHQAAAATIEACGAARARAFNGYQWAATLLARDGPGDRQRATEMVEETLLYCRTKGYATFTGKAEELLATIR
jgi:hypothetical protein